MSVDIIQISKDELLQLLMKFKDYNEVENYLHSFENAKSIILIILF
jgi:hypothetical protein